MEIEKQKQNSALIIINMQNDFMEGGSIEVKNASTILPYINSLRKKFKTIFLVKDYHPKQHISFAETHNTTSFQIVKLSNGKQQMVFPQHCVQNTWGCEFYKDLDKQASDIIIQIGSQTECDSLSGFGNDTEKTKLNQLLKEKQIKNLFIVGLSIMNTAVDGANQGYNVFIVKEGTLFETENEKQEILRLLKLHNIQYISIDEVNKYL